MTSNDDPCRGQGWLWHVSSLVFRTTCPQGGDNSKSFGLRIVRKEAFLGQEGGWLDNPSVYHDLLFPIPKALPLTCNSRTRQEKNLSLPLRQGLSQMGATFLSLPLWPGNATPALVLPGQTSASSCLWAFTTFQPLPPHPAKSQQDLWSSVGSAHAQACPGLERGERVLKPFWEVRGQTPGLSFLLPQPRL